MDNSLYGNTKAMSTRACIYSSLWMYCSLCTAMFKRSSVLHQTLVHTNNGTTVRLWWTFSWLLYIWNTGKICCVNPENIHTSPLWKGFFQSPWNFQLSFVYFLNFCSHRTYTPRKFQSLLQWGMDFFWNATFWVMQALISRSFVFLYFLHNRQE